MRGTVTWNQKEQARIRVLGEVERGRMTVTQAAIPGSAYAPIPESLDLATICCFKYRRTVANDNTVRFAN